ncbi:MULTISPECIES: hypothetical protein [unclassified Streptomyces]|uniref:hypothetical protein n=1 Tax=unclassified Streptomyces TaxID=2593676 RepID=UPI0008873B8A|nr:MULTISPECIES: hypothetical protein [unclassified Streptomyces]PBC86574.1 hypothetical protein BX261_6672 [Streptomyces sp. 2321.6]SDQ79659.1 hypothetical protein SAMN05216511_0578 [Streptomyces sp. KS_16]SEE02757.1 hypothetical protein SAMN05428940_6699 [Streptomyces sp. 2133.1]SNC73632.1 hypothetical protein SAMN06272741_6601 [Streptomyces sp. 2114.4]
MHCSPWPPHPRPYGGTPWRPAASNPWSTVRWLAKNDDQIADIITTQDRHETAEGLLRKFDPPASYTAVGRFFSRTGTDVATVATLDSVRARLLDARAADRTHTADDLTARWHAHLQHVLQAGPATGDDLRDLLASLQRLTNTAPSIPRATVHNDISGGTQHGPVIQSGRITGLTLHVHHSAGSPQD